MWPSCRNFKNAFWNWNAGRRDEPWPFRPNGGAPDRSAFPFFPQIEKAVIYGSRAKGNYRPGSDLDLTLFGGQLDHALLTAIGNELDDLLLPYKIDLSLFHQLTQPELIEHIQRVGLVLYEKAAAKKEPK